MTVSIHSDFNVSPTLVFLNPDIDGTPAYLAQLHRFSRSLWKSLKATHDLISDKRLRDPDSYIQHLEMIIHGLCVSLSDKRCRGLNLYLRMEEYGSKGSLSKLSYDRVVNLIEMLTTLRDPEAMEPYCSIYIGSKVAERTSILHARPWLKDALVREGLIFYGCPFVRKSHKPTQLGFLRLNETPQDDLEQGTAWFGGDKEEIGKVSKRLARPATELEAYIPKLTSLLRKADLRLSLPNYWAYQSTLYRGKSPGSWYSRIQPEATMFYRAFNDVDGQGGRIFGHHFQHLKSDLRQYLRIGGERMIEVDYQSCQPCLAYSLLGLERPSDDLYDIGVPYGPSDRAMLKKVFLIGVGSKANGQPARTLVLKDADDRKRNRSKKAVLTYDQAKALDAAFWQHHEAISEFRCSGAWRRLQYEESQIALTVIRTLVDQRIAVLPLHDGFLVTRKHQDALMKAMIDAVSGLSCPPRPVLKF